MFVYNEMNVPYVLQLCRCN